MCWSPGAPTASGQRSLPGLDRVGLSARQTGADHMQDATPVRGARSAIATNKRTGGRGSARRRAVLCVRLDLCAFLPLQAGISDISRLPAPVPRLFLACSSSVIHRSRPNSCRYMRSFGDGLPHRSRQSPVTILSGFGQHASRLCRFGTLGLRVCFWPVWTPGSMEASRKHRVPSETDLLRAG